MKTAESPRPGTREYAANDLRKLLGRSQEEFKVEEDMPPLLQVCNLLFLPHLAKHSQVELL